MIRKSKKAEPDFETLSIRLQEAEDTLEAIRNGKVDALIVSGQEGEQVYTLKGADQSYRLILEKMAEGALTLAGDSILYANSCFAQMVGAPLPSVAGSSFLRFLSPRDHERFESLLKRAADESVKDEFELIRRDLTDIWVNISVSCIKMQDEKSILCLIVTDLTARNQAEKEILQAKDDLEDQVLKRTAELAITNKELLRSNLELEQFAYIASHDLQEPLRTISNYVDLLMLKQKESLSQDGNRFLGFIQTGALHAQELIQSLLQYANITAKDYPLEFAELNTLLGQALSDLKILIEENNAQVTHDPLPRVKVNSLQITQLFLNLISNAIKYRSASAPKIHISARQENQKWVISVKDNGIGIEPQYKERIFMIFKRLHSRTKYPGTGIGLAICKKIVQRHGGEIWLEPSPQNGSTFCFSLPVIKNEVPE